MNSDPVFDKLSALLHKVLGEIGQVTLDAKLVEDYDANSMDMVDLADRAEEVFKIDFPTEDMKKMITVADILKYIKERSRNENAPTPKP